jgi:hypothetical protein
MSTEPRQHEERSPLWSAIAGLRDLARKSKSPTRHQARDLLLVLGAEIRTGDPREVEESIAALGRITPTFGDRWPMVVAEELALACTEHVRSVEPRFLDHPQYDFEYTLAARERLELRLCAAEKLGSPATPGWLAQVARADALLAASLERRGKTRREGR